VYGLVPPALRHLNSGLCRRNPGEVGVYRAHLAGRLWRRNPGAYFWWASVRDR
jgi:hypothetical protein